MPPRHDVKLLKPVLQLLLRLLSGESVQTSQVDGLVTDLHLLIESTLLRQVADMAYIFVGHLLAVEQYGTAVGEEDFVDNLDECTLAGAVGTEESEYAIGLDLYGDIVEGEVVLVSLDDMLCF